MDVRSRYALLTYAEGLYGWVAGGVVKKPDLGMPLPESRDVRKELVELRSGRGVTSEKIRKVAPLTQLLPIVSDELLRLRLSEYDRPVAANSAMECAVKHRLRRSDLRAILVGTLNFDGRAGNLTERRADLKAVLGYGEKAYAEHEAEAYSELATLLLRLKQTVCGSGQQDDDYFRSSSRSERLDALLTPKQQHDLGQLLRLLIIDERSVTRGAIRDLVFAALPELTAQLRGGDSTPLFAYGTNELSFLVRRAIVGGYRSRLDQMDEVERGTYWTWRQMSDLYGIVMVGEGSGEPLGPIATMSKSLALLTDVLAKAIGSEWWFGGANALGRLRESHSGQIYEDDVRAIARDYEHRGTQSP